MKENFPKFTIIIPEKDRKEYLYYTIKTCIEQDYPNLDIIVADDASTDGTQEMVYHFSSIDPRVRLISRPQRIGMRDNFEFALDEVKEGFVIVLGGDDGILPNGIRGMYEIYKQTGAKLITWSPAKFDYPTPERPHGQFYIYRHKYGLKEVNSNEYLARQSTLLHYLRDIECPMMYVKGVAHIDLINIVKSRSENGCFYQCPTPDGYSGIVLAGEVDSFIFSGKPLTLYGATPASQGQAYLSKKKEAQRDSAEFFKFSEQKTMHPELANQPYSPLMALMTVDYLYTARDLPGWKGNVVDVDFKEVIRKSVEELSAAYDEVRTKREIEILEKIAEQHNLLDYYHSLLKNAKMRVTKAEYVPWGISKDMIYVDPYEFGITNLVEAAYAHDILRNSFKYMGFGFYFKLLKNSAKIFLNRSRKSGKLLK